MRITQRLNELKVENEQSNIFRMTDMIRASISVDEPGKLFEAYEILNKMPK